MTHVSPPNLGNIITSANIRKIVYGAYAISAVIVGGISAYFLGIGESIPTAVIGAQAVIAYLGIPVGGLALANTPSKEV